MQAIDVSALTEATRTFFLKSIRVLEEADIPFLVGGAYALAHYTGISRHTKDLDVFLRPGHCRQALEVLAEAGYRTELTSEDWLGKAFCDDDFVDLIFSSRNRIAVVDDDWFRYAHTGRFLDREILLAPPEETIWSKGFIMERERYDGADIAHILHAQADRLDWQRLLRRFDPYWRVLLSHLILFGFIYPSEKDRIPSWLMRELARRLAAETDEAAPKHRRFRGKILSGTQYEIDEQDWGYEDASGLGTNHRDAPAADESTEKPTGTRSEGEA